MEEELCGGGSGSVSARLVAVRLQCELLEKEAALVWNGPPPPAEQQKARVRAAEERLRRLQARLEAQDIEDVRGGGPGWECAAGSAE